MILAVHKQNGATYEHVSCDGLKPVMYIKDKAGIEYRVRIDDFDLVFDNNPKFELYLLQRV